MKDSYDPEAWKAWDAPLDCKEGVERLFSAARFSGLVLSEYHERLAQKHGVSTDGVTISRPLRTQ